MLIFILVFFFFNTVGQLSEFISVQRKCSLIEARGVFHKLQKDVMLTCFASSQNVVTLGLHRGNDCNSIC